MASTPSIQVSQADVISVDSLITPNILMSQADVLSVYNVPAVSIEASSTDVTYVSKNLDMIEVSQADILAIIRGRVDDPAVRAWTFTLDGHDFYVLRLGNQETLIYDVTSQQWSVWGSNDMISWFVYTGSNWVGGNTFASEYGSNIVVGSDANGSIFILDPNKAKDDSPTNGREPSSFTRQVTAQIPIRGYNAVRVFEVQLLGSVNELEDSFDTDIELLYSDDRGQSYISAGVITTVADDYDVRASWRSLGSFDAPGRLFRVQDTGALQRIDSLSANTSMENGS